MADRTPGEVAYEAFWQAFSQTFGTHGDDSWGTIHPGTRACWDAAAQAVAARAVADTLEVQRILAGAVRRVEETP